MKLSASLSLVAVLLAGQFAEADIFRLQSGGEVRGTLSPNASASPERYVIDTTSGGQVTLARTQVKAVVRQSKDEMEYDRIRSKYGDTVEDQWKLAEWCREHSLLKPRAVHLMKIIELDPNHAKARRALGYSQVKGRWMLKEEAMAEKGYVLHQGKWRLPQEVELMKAQSEQAGAEKEWMKKIKRWNSWLTGDRSTLGRQNIQAIEDPHAVPALTSHLSGSSSRNTKLLYGSVLAKIATPAAMDALVRASMSDADEEVRVFCFERIAEQQYKPAVSFYIQSLKSKNNAVINQAAVGLAYMKDSAAMGPLIDALITTHRFRLAKGDPRQVSSTFSNAPGAGGFSFGSSEKIVDAQIQNRAVLDALVQLTGQNFEYNIGAWKDWYAAQKRGNLEDARRD